MIISNTGRTLYNGYDVASTNYVYTENASVGTDDGWHPARADHIAIQLCCATLNASSLTYRIEGRSKTYTRPCDIYNASIPSAQDIDTIVNISEHVDEVRLGVKITGVATPNNFYAGLILAESK